MSIYDKAARKKFIPRCHPKLNGMKVVIGDSVLTAKTYEMGPIPEFGAPFYEACSKDQSVHVALKDGSLTVTKDGKPIQNYAIKMSGPQFFRRFSSI
jgi:hypothetical protein